MAFMDKLKFHVLDQTSAVIDLIKKWQPEDCKTEKSYEKSLIDWIRTELPNVQVTPQYAIGRSKADLVIAEKVIVEIKINLKSMGESQRLIGQLSEYSNWDGQIIVLLIGKHDPDIQMNIEKFSKNVNEEMTNILKYSSGKIHVVLK